MYNKKVRSRKMRKVLSIVLTLLLLFTLTAHAEGDWHNILLLGGDAEAAGQYDRSDSMIILSINRDESLVKMTSIMRDTWVDFPDRGAPGKINAATVYGGPELAVATVNRVFGMDIEDYVMINMSDMRRIIDLMGGVDVELTAAEAAHLKLGKGGRTHLDGDAALAYSRIRSIDDDYHRVMRQQNVLLAMADRAQNMELDALAEIADGVLEILRTNMEDESLKDLMMALLSMDAAAAERYRIPADGTFSAGMRGGVWRIDADFAQNVELLHRFIYGE